MITPWSEIACFLEKLIVDTFILELESTLSLGSEVVNPPLKVYTCRPVHGQGFYHFLTIVLQQSLCSFFLYVAHLIQEFTVSTHISFLITKCFPILFYIKQTKIHQTCGLCSPFM